MALAELPGRRNHEKRSIGVPLSPVRGIGTIPVASIALLVGGIGVMNIMLVSVTERTREIGLRKALGATKTDILSQFLFEAALLGIIGGGLGVGFGWGVATVAAAMTDWPFEVSPSVVSLVTGITALVGLVFGFWPAKKAAALQPIQALKYE